MNSGEIDNQDVSFYSQVKQVALHCIRRISLTFGALADGSHYVANAKHVS